jgi:hypothetical protein
VEAIPQGTCVKGTLTTIGLSSQSSDTLSLLPIDQL